MADSKGQYQQALQGIYSDHHPPLMSFIWHYFLKIHDGPGLMYLLQLSFLYASIGYLLKTVMITKRSFGQMAILLLAPLYPQIMIYTAEIAKDNQFAFSFLFVASVLSYYTATYKKLTLLPFLFLMTILLYGASVKYQGQFVAAALLVWMGLLKVRHSSVLKKISTIVAISALFYIPLNLIPEVLIPSVQKNHSWQWVKLYDLAAISLKTQTDLIPDFNKRPSYTTEELYKRYHPQSVDAYIYFDDPIFKITDDEQEMTALWKTWAIEVVKHPFIYAYHRAGLIGYALLSRPGFQYVGPFLEKFFPAKSSLYSVFYHLSEAIYFIFMSHLATIILGLFYVALAIKTWKNSTSAKVLLGLSMTGLLMPCVIFVFSMAGNPRYTYISIVFIYCCHVFAYDCLTLKKEFKTPLGKEIT